MKYRVTLNGRNFLLRFTQRRKQKQKHGFYVTRDVEAESFEEAELNAVELVRNEERIKSLTLNPKDDPPMLYLEEIHLLDDDEEGIINSGYTYYPEDETA